MRKRSSARQDKGYPARRIQAFISARRRTWTRWLQRLVQIPSPFESEQAVLKETGIILQEIGFRHPYRIWHRARRLRALPAAQKPISARRDRYSLVVRVAGSGRGRSLILNAHLDTVQAGDAAHWSHKPYSGHIDAQRGLIYGRGSMDNKAGVVVALSVLDIVLNNPLRLRGDLLLHLVIEDETTGNGTLLCLDAGHRADAAFIIDGTRPNRAVGEHAGQMQFHITVHGEPASVSVSHLGINAVELAARLALELKEKVANLNQKRSKRWQIYPSPFQCSLQKIDSSAETFTVTGWARGQWYLTFCPPYSLEKMESLLRSWVVAFARRHALPSTPHIEIGYAVEPVKTSSQPIEAILKQEVSRSKVAGFALVPSTGTSDLRHYTAAGIPGLLYGPGRGYNPHRPDEYYHLDDLSQMASLYTSLAAQWCGVALI